MNVVSFWAGGPIDRLRRLCLASQVRLAKSVTVYSYGEVGGLPDGVATANAAEILPMAFMDRLRASPASGAHTHVTIIQFSDFFRARLLRLGKGVWIDPDVYLLRPFTIDRHRAFFAWEGRWRLGNSVLYLPADHPVILDYEKLIAADDLWPPWFSLRLRLLRSFRQFKRGTKLGAADFSIAMYGPLLLTVLARRHGALGDALPQKSFYSIHARHDLFFEPGPFKARVEDPDILGLHISPKTRGNEASLPGSLYDWAERNLD